LSTCFFPSFFVFSLFRDCSYVLGFHWWLATDHWFHRSALGCLLSCGHLFFLESLATHSSALLPPWEAVSQFVIPAKPRETGREPGSRISWIDLVFLDSGSRNALHRSSGMMVYLHCDTVSDRGGLALLNMNYLEWLILNRFKSVLEHVYSKPP
jgi:hypothetical protein